MSMERKVSEPKPSKCKTFTYRTVKLGNKMLGTIEPQASEDPKARVAVYWVTSPLVARISDGGRTVFINRSKLAGLSAYGVKKVGLRMPDGSTYLAAMDKVSQALGAFVSLAVEECEVSLPSVDDRSSTLFGAMRIAGSRRSASKLRAA